MPLQGSLRNTGNLRLRDVSADLVLLSGSSNGTRSAPVRADGATISCLLSVAGGGQALPWQPGSDIPVGGHVVCEGIFELTQELLEAAELAPGAAAAGIQLGLNVAARVGNTGLEPLTQDARSYPAALVVLLPVSAQPQVTLHINADLEACMIPEGPGTPWLAGRGPRTCTCLARLP